MTDVATPIPTPQPTATAANPVPDAATIDPSTIAPANTPAIINSGVPTPQAPPPPPKESFKQGFQRAANPSYTTDAQGNPVSTEPPVRRSVKGVLGSILAGALRGAQAGMSAQAPEGSQGRGAAFSAAAKQAQEDAITRDLRARQIAQQQFANNMAVRNQQIQDNLNVAREMKLTQIMDKPKADNPSVKRAQDRGEDAAAKQLGAVHSALLANSQQAVSDLDDMGLNVAHELLHHSDLVGHEYALAHGSEIPLQNGSEGDSNGIILLNTAELKNHVLTPGKAYVYSSYDGSIDKNGDLVATPQVLTGDGRLTAYDLVQKFLGSRQQLMSYAEQVSGGVTLRHHAEVVKQNQPKTTAIPAAFQAQYGGEPTTNQFNGQTYPDVASAQRAWGVQLQTYQQSQKTKPTKTATGGETDAALVDEIGTGKMDLSRLDYLAARNPQLLAQVAAKYPGFDSSKVKSYVSVYKDFTSGKTSVALNSGSTALKHLAELQQLNTIEARIPETQARAAFRNKLNTLVAELQQFYGTGHTDETITKFEQDMNALRPAAANAAITSQAQSMADKFASYVQQWRNAAPSRAYEAPLPKIDAQAVKALLTLDPTFQTKYPDIILTRTNKSNPNDRIYSLDGGHTWDKLPQ